MEHPLKTLLYELFVEPVLRLLIWPIMRRAKVAEITAPEDAAVQVPTGRGRAH